MRLTKKVLDGLCSLAGFVESGSCADIMGNDYEYLDRDDQRSWDNILLAIEWIREKQK